MRRLAFLLSLLVLSFPLLAVSLSVAEGVNADDEVIRLLERALNEKGAALFGKDPVSIEVDSYSEDDAAVYVSAAGYTLAFDKEDLAQSIGSQVEAFLTYPDFLPLRPGNRLDYIYDSSFSTYSLPDARAGQVYDLMSADGSTAVSRFIVSDAGQDGLVKLDPLHVGQAHAGLELKRKSAFVLTASFSQVFSPEYLFYLSFRVKNTALLYPFNPSLGFEWGQDGEGNDFCSALAGIEYTAYLGGLIDSSFTLIQEGRLFAGLDLVLSYAKGGFAWGASWRAGYTYALSRNFSFSAGLESIYLRSGQRDEVLLNQYRLLLSVGVML